MLIEKARQEAEALMEKARQEAAAQVAAIRAQAEEAIRVANEAHLKAMQGLQAVNEQAAPPAPAPTTEPLPSLTPQAPAKSPAQMEAEAQAAHAAALAASDEVKRQNIAMIQELVRQEEAARFAKSAAYTSRVELRESLVPKTVVDENGIERPLTPEEEAAAKAMEEELTRARAAARAAAREQRLKAAAAGVPLPAIDGRVGEWYYIMNGEAVGPVLAVELQDKIADHTISPPIKMIWTAGMQRWTPVYDCPDLWNKENEVYGSR